MEKIFVSIASYRDAECQWTLKHMFEQADNPQRVFAGICWVRNETDDKECFTVSNAFPSHVRTVFYTPEEEKGINWARAEAFKLWQDEDYVLQIHSHMRFAKGWDTLLIKHLSECPSQKSLLSTSLPAYTPPDTYPFRDTTITAFTTVTRMSPDATQYLTLTGRLVSNGTAVVGPMRNAFAVSCFLFGRAEVFREVPHDPHIYYYNTELAYSARLWTHGYDIFQPPCYILFHWYGRPETFPRSYRDPANPRHVLSNMRIQHLLRYKAADKSEAIVDMDSYGLGKERSIEEFWKLAGVNLNRSVVAEYATRGNFELPYADIVKKRVAPKVPEPTMFIQIASYRDPECQWTIKDLFDKATYPDRINVGVCWQYDPEEDKDCFQVVVRPEQVRITPFNWQESQGVCWARHQAQTLYEGETYVLMIDSHIRFEFGWDEFLIRELDKCKSEKSILSNHPARYTPPHDLETKAFPTGLNSGKFTEHGDIRIAGGYMHKRPPAPLRGAFVAGGFIFSTGKLIKEVPYDPYMYFNQEEMSLSARFFTHGWDVYHPSKAIAYHLYNHGDELKRRKLHWSDNKEWGKTQERAKKRFDHLFEYAITDDPAVLRDLTLYGLGDVRTLAEFEAFTEIDFKKRTVGDKAINYGVTEELRRYMRNEPVSAPGGGSVNVLTFPRPDKSAVLPFEIMQLANGEQRLLDVVKDVPDNVLIINNFIEPAICNALARYADAQTFTDLGTVDPTNTTEEKVASKMDEGRVTTHVDIDGMACEVLNIFNDIYCHRMAPFFKADFEWYERPQILRYPKGGKYNAHADADHWEADKNEWLRVQDRDFSVLLYLNDDYEGGELQFVNQGFTIKPKPGMLVAFPSDHKYLHAALPTTSGIRYVIVSWGAVLGTKRVRKTPPYASVFVRQKRLQQS